MKVYFSKRAEKNYQSIKEYLTEEWGKGVAEAFEEKTIDLIDLLESFPKIGTMEYPGKQILGFQLTKQNRVFYRIKKEKIIILAFFDTRQNPKKKPGQ